MWKTGRWAEQIHLHSLHQLPNHANRKGAESVQVRTLEALIGRARRHEDKQRQIQPVAYDTLIPPKFTENQLRHASSRILQEFGDFYFVLNMERCGGMIILYVAMVLWEGFWEEELTCYFSNHSASCNVWWVNNSFINRLYKYPRIFKYRNNWEPSYHSLSYFHIIWGSDTPKK